MAILANLLFSVPIFAGGSEDDDSSDSDGGQVILSRSQPPKKDNEKESPASVSGDLTLPYDPQLLVALLKANRVSPGTGRIFLAELAVEEAKAREESTRRELARLESERFQAKIIFREAQQKRIEQETRLAALRAEEELVRKQKEVAETRVEPQDKGSIASARSAASASAGDVLFSDRHRSVSSPRGNTTKKDKSKKEEKKKKKGRK